MLLCNARRAAVALSWIVMLVGLLPLVGCSHSATSSTDVTGDKKDDPAIKATMKDQMESYKAKAQSRKSGRQANR
jgi:hypothetical protein